MTRRATLALIAHALLICSLFSATRRVFAEPSDEPRFERRLASELRTGGLTSDEVVRRALSTSFEVGARKAQLVAAVADADRALLGYLPDVTVSASYTRLSDVGVANFGNLVAAPGRPSGSLAAQAQLVNVPIELRNLLNLYLLKAELLVPVSDYFLRVAPTRSAAEHARYAASANVETARARVATDARVAYYSWVRAKLAVVVAEQALEDVAAHLADSRVAEAAGSASPADTLRLESQVARSELYLLNSRSLAAVAEQQVRTHMHDFSGRVLTIGEDIRQPVAGQARTDATAQLLQLYDEALRNRPELSAIREQVLVLSNKARFERAGLLPRLEAFAQATYANPNPRVLPPEDDFRGSWLAGVRLSWLISDVPSANLRSRALEAQSAAASNDRSALIDRIQVEVDAAAHAVDDAILALHTTQRGLDAAEESYRVRRLSFQNGRSTSVELLDAETDLTRARLERLDAEVDTRVATARLDYAVGRVLNGSQSGKGSR
jgi:outer membrane protein TolC